MSLARRAGPDWPRVLCPAPGCAPPRAAPRGDERVLHVGLGAIFSPDEVRSATGALRRLAGSDADYRAVPMATDSTLDADALEAAAALRPTLVFLQPQCASVLDPAWVADLRPLCDPDAVVVNWTGDQHAEPGEPGLAWLEELGRAVDATLVVNTKHPAELAARGVRHPGYLQVGVDTDLWRPTAPTPGTPAVVCLANRWPAYRAKYAARDACFARVAADHPGGFAVYGHGWDGQDEVPHRPLVPCAAEAGVYSAARAALSISIRCDLARYTSNRLFYALASGAVVLAERFPDCEGLGLLEGVNCWLWRDLDDLECLLGTVLDPGHDDAPLRAGARALALEGYSLAAFAEHLAAIVDAVRAERRP